MRSLAALTLLLSAAATAAQASTIIIQNTTDNVAYSTGTNGGPDGFYNGSDVGSAPVGSNFATSQLALTTTLLTSGNYAIDLQYSTLFAGAESVGSASVYYPDIFLRSSAAGYSNAPFDYAISLGDEGANGGMSAGLYSVSSYLTSQQVWSSRPGYIYTGQYTNSATAQPGQTGYAGYNAPVVATTGTQLASAAINTTQQADSSYLLDVQLTLTPAQAAIFANGFDIFWGTGDCANGSFLASVAAMAGAGTPASLVPEPATLLLLAAAATTLITLRRRSNP